MKKKSSKFRLLKGILCISILIILSGAIVVLGIMTNIIDRRDSMKEENSQIAKIIDNCKEEKTIDVINKGDEDNGIIEDYNDIPQELIDAVTSIEDKRFMKHIGIDYIRTMGAIFSYIKNEGDSNYGGSTITQQLIKVTTGDDERSWTRKIREWSRAIYIETKLSKEQIILTYLNTIYLGDNNYGIEKATMDFFGKKVKDLTLAESSVIAAKIQSPEGTNPYKSKEARDRLLLRKDVVLKEMYELGKISKEEYDKAIIKDIVFVRGV